MEPLLVPMLMSLSTSPPSRPGRLLESPTAADTSGTTSSNAPRPLAEATLLLFDPDIANVRKTGAKLAVPASTTKHAASLPAIAQRVKADSTAKRLLQQPLLLKLPTLLPKNQNPPPRHQNGLDSRLLILPQTTNLPSSKTASMDGPPEDSFTQDSHRLSSAWLILNPRKSSRKELTLIFTTYQQLPLAQSTLSSQTVQHQISRTWVGQPIKKPRKDGIFPRFMDLLN